MYYCCLCETTFPRPAARRWLEPMPDGFAEPCCQAVCPTCGATEQYFDQIYKGVPHGKRLRSPPP